MKKPKKPKITVKKYQGDDLYSWAVFKNGWPVVTGCSRGEAQYYRNQLKKEKQNV